MNVESDRPEFVMVRLPHLHLRHPIKDFARVEIAKNAPLKFQQQRRMNRIREIEQNIRSTEALEQLAFRNSDAPQRVQVMRVGCRILVEQTIPAGQSVRAQLPLEILNLAGRAAASSVAGRSSSQIASSFSRRNPSIHCSGTEKLPPPSRYFAANPQPRKIVTRAESLILLARSSTITRPRSFQITSPAVSRRRLMPPY